MTNEYEQVIADARRDYNRSGGVEPINGHIPVPWKTKRDLAIWLMYLAYVFPMRASRHQYTHAQIYDLVRTDWGISEATYYNYLAVMKQRGWMIPSQVMTQWEQACYMNGPAWQKQREEECGVVHHE